MGQYGEPQISKINHVIIKHVPVTSPEKESKFIMLSLILNDIIKN